MTPQEPKPEEHSKIYTEADWQKDSTLSKGPYRMSKRVAEETAWSLSQDSGYDLVVINPSFILGPGAFSRADGVSMKFMKDALEGRLVAGTSAGAMGVVDVRDVAVAHIAGALEPGAGDKRFLVTSDASLTKLEMLNLLRNTPEFGGRFAFPQTEDGPATFRARFSPARRTEILKTSVRLTADTVVDMARWLIQNEYYDTALAEQMNAAAKVCLAGSIPAPCLEGLVGKIDTMAPQKTRCQQEFMTRCAKDRAPIDGNDVVVMMHAAKCSQCADMNKGLFADVGCTPQSLNDLCAVRATPVNTNCVGAYGACGVDCKKMYAQSVKQAGTGTPCEAANGASVPCNPGEGACPKPPEDCASSWSVCTATCEKGPVRTWTGAGLKPPGTGNPCPAVADDCAPGMGACVQTAPANTACAGTWSICTAACEKGASRTWVQTVAPSGTGAPCPVQAPDCNGGDGACPVAIPNIACEGSWSACTAVCEKGPVRTWTQTVVPSGTGTVCPVAAPDCTPGADACPAAPADVNCEGSFSACTVACEKAAARAWAQTVAPSGSGAVCPAEAEDCQPGEGACPANVACEGSFSACTAACEKAAARSWTQDVVPMGAGEPCPVAQDCGPGEDQCPVPPADVNCEGSWSPCSAVCEQATVRTWVQDVAPSGNGAACPAAAENCEPGEGECPKNVACVGEFSVCTAACEKSDARSWAQSVAPTGDGAPCPVANDCVPGDGACPVVTNTACEGSWSACTAVCEKGPVRTWTQTVVPSGTGTVCPVAAPDCTPGADACPAAPADVNCEGSFSACTVACEKAAARAWAQTVAPSGSGAVCPAEAEDCQPGEGACPAAAPEVSATPPAAAAGLSIEADTAKLAELAAAKTAAVAAEDYPRAAEIKAEIDVLEAKLAAAAETPAAAAAAETPLVPETPPATPEVAEAPATPEGPATPETPPEAPAAAATEAPEVPADTATPPAPPQPSGGDLDALLLAAVQEVRPLST